MRCLEPKIEGLYSKMVLKAEHSCFIYKVWSYLFCLCI